MFWMAVLGAGSTSVIKIDKKLASIELIFQLEEIDN